MKKPSVLSIALTAAVIVAFAPGCASDSGSSSSSAKPAAAPATTTAAVAPATAAAPEKAPAPEKAKAPEKKKKSKYNCVANPPKVKFGQFKFVEVKPTTLAEKHRDHKGNQESAGKIDAMLLQQLHRMFETVKPLAAGAEFSKPAERTLQMEPYIEDIRLISTGTRIWLGAMAGGSDLLIKVTYRDSQTGEVIGDPQFAAGNNAWSGAWSYGATDNQLRDSVVLEIMGYMSMNK